MRWVAEEADEAGDDERRGEGVDADEELLEEESVGAAFAYVARVDVLKELIGDEVVVDEPEEVWKED